MCPPNLCMHCMNGSVAGGRCTTCHAIEGPEQNRSLNALPYRMVLHDRYQIGRVIGCGGFGITYLAWDMEQDMRVAVKELYPNKDVTRATDKSTLLVHPGQEDYFEHVRRRFLEEAGLLIEFQQARDILRIYHLFTENRTAYYVMEYLEGTNLKSWMQQNGVMRWETLAAYMKPILKSLRLLHGKDLIHRDISPDNIMLLRNGTAKLIDFGSVRCYVSTKGLTTFLKHNFAPFEQYRENGNQGPWTDIYALSVTMYYALSGVLPPKAPDRVMASEETVPIDEFCPTLPKHVADAVMKGMAVLLEERFQSIDSFVHALYPEAHFTQQEPQRIRYPGTSGPVRQTGACNQEVACIQGYFNKVRWNIPKGQVVSVGRSETCQIRYPSDFRSVSRMQCSLYVDEKNQMYIRDENSTYGTYTERGRLTAGVWYPLRPGMFFWFANEKFQVVLGGYG